MIEKQLFGLIISVYIFKKTILYSFVDTRGYYKFVGGIISTIYVYLRNPHTNTVHETIKLPCVYPSN